MTHLSCLPVCEICTETHKISSRSIRPSLTASINRQIKEANVYLANQGTIKQNAIKQTTSTHQRKAANPDQIGVAVIESIDGIPFEVVDENRLGSTAALIKEQWGWELDPKTGHNITAKKLLDSGVGYKN